MEEKKKGRKAYLNDFKQNKDGKYVYTGNRYAYRGQGISLESILFKLWLFGVCAAAVCVAGGFIPAAGVNHCPYVLLPYMAGLLFSISVCWGVGRLTAGGARLREYVYQATVEKIPGRSAACGICMALALAGEILYIILNGAGKEPAYSALFLVLMAAGAAGSFGVRCVMSKVQWEKMEQEA